VIRVLQRGTRYTGSHAILITPSPCFKSANSLVYEITEIDIWPSDFSIHLPTRILLEKGIPIKPWKYNPTKTRR
jgi:hypothetical protein